MKEMILIAALFLGLGMFFERAGQHGITQRYNQCMESNIQDVKTMDELLALDAYCQPSAVVKKIFFW